MTLFVGAHTKLGCTTWRTERVLRIHTGNEYTRTYFRFCVVYLFRVFVMVCLVVRVVQQAALVSLGVTKVVEVEISKSKAISSKVRRNTETWTVILRFSGFPVWGVKNTINLCKRILQQENQIFIWSPAYGLMKSVRLRNLEIRAILGVWQYFWSKLDILYRVFRSAHSG